MTRIFEGAQLTSGAPHVMWTRVKGASVPNWTTLFSRRTAPYHRGRTRFLPPSRRALVTPIPRSRTHFQKSSSLERVRRQGDTPLHHTHERAHISCHCTPCTYMPLFFPSSISTGPEEHHPSSGDHMPQQVYSSASESESPWASLANNDPSSAPKKKID